MKLRRRIIDAMPEILKVIANEKRGIGMGGDGDFRPAVVQSIQRIAELDPLPAYKERSNLDKASNHLRRAKQLIEEAQRFSAVRDLDSVLEKVKEMRKRPLGTGRKMASRKRLAASVACELLLDFGGARVSRTCDGAYVKLANLLHKTAVGGDSDLHRVCKQRLKELWANDELDLYAPKGGRPRPPPEINRLMEADVAAFRAQRIEAAKKWPPLQQVVDRVLKEQN